ncbi:Arabinose operon regulatory protein [Variovorax sp. SRS16]|uniref:helix-turn-helix transcriptional regulator n=1 Tax=Variovorax sp. SRS16 TaxID=282217 RepID=UPI0013192AAB|nr:AraC family transcriptional regulator [Variovorax sp. SRS16]VTU15364.1 Arabinose operon regulatory protein [Variovorax sp. SRS16]
MQVASNTAADRLKTAGPSARLMWITPDRIFYAGLLGAPGVRTMGSLMIYVATEGSIRIAVGGGEWETGEMAIVHPYQPHQLLSEAMMINLIKIEAETMEIPSLPPLLARSGIVDAPQFVERVRRRQRELCELGSLDDLNSLDFDRFFFDRPLVPKVLDRRIQEIVEMIKRHPSAPSSAEECAEAAHLSFSRFLHLFKQEVGVSFRTFRKWKRARSVLRHVNEKANLAHVALDNGYPDSTHFSHCIKQVYGLRPKEIFAGSRRLVVYATSGSARG